MNSSGVEKERSRRFGFNAPAKSLLMASGLLLAATLYGGPASAATLTVGTCKGSSPYVTIQEAVAAANAGDTVQVCPGTYAESVLIEQNLTLVGITLSHRGRTPTLPIIVYPSTGRTDELPCLAGKLCPQVFVKNSTAAHIANLEVNGSNFGLDACNLNPVGILFEDSGGTVGGAISANHDSPCEGAGYDQGNGIVVVYTQPGKFSVDITNNQVSGFAQGGIVATGAYSSSPTMVTPINFTGAISNNTVTTTLNSPNDSPEGIQVDYSQAFTISGNSISLPTLIDGLPPGYVGIYASNSTQLSMGKNSVTNYLKAIESFALDSSTVENNTVSNSYYGVWLGCSGDNKIARNQINGHLPRGSAAGISLSNFCGGEPDQPSDDNTINRNVIDGFCAGIVNMSSTDTGNTYNSNAFSDDSVDIMLSPAAPCF